MLTRNTYKTTVAAPVDRCIQLAAPKMRQLVSNIRNVCSNHIDPGKNRKAINPCSTTASLSHKRSVIFELQSVHKQGMRLSVLKDRAWSF